MRLLTFGALAITNDHDVARDPPIQRRQLALLAVLAATGPAGVTRDQLLALLWPEQEGERARHALDQSLYAARKIVGSEAIVSNPTSLVLDARILASDVAEFVRALERRDLEAAVAVYAGPFLDGVYVGDAAEFERWVAGRRRYFADAYVRALIELAAAESGAGHFPRSVGYLRRAAASDPLSGTVAHALMTALAAAGDRAAALDVGRVYASLVHDELDAVADTAVRRLMDQLRMGNVRATSDAGRPLVTTPVAPMPRPSVTRLEALLGERYRIVRELGSGGMATVYLARDLKHDRDVAVKVLRPEVGALLGSERFLNEIRISARLDHPHILTLIDSGTVEELIYFVLPYVSGESLRARLEREHQLPIDEALSIAEQIASALDYAHRLGVVHRDIKPENILLRERDAVLTDFGIAVAVREAGGHRITETGFSLGTPQYMSPEQATGARDLDGRSDIYSLAAVLYELLTGEAPHSGPSVQSVVAKLLTERPTKVRVLRPTVPEHVEAAVMRGLEKIRADRFATADEFARTLGGGTFGTDVRSRGPLSSEPAEPARPARRRSRLAMAVMVVGAAALVAGGIVAQKRLFAPPAVVRAAFGVARQVTFSGHAEEPVLSPDGHSLAFIQHDSLYLLDLAGGEPRLLPTGKLRAWLPRWTRDGAVIRFLVTRARGERAGVYMVPRLGGPAQPFDGDPEEVLFTEQLTLPSAISPVGERFAAQLWPDTLSRDTVQLPAPYYNAFFPLAISPNREWIAIAAASRDWAGLVLWSRTAHRATVLATEGAGPRWSIAGDRVDFKSREGIMTVAVDTLTGRPSGSQEVLLANPDAWDFSVADDRSRIAFVRSSEHQRIWLVGLGSARLGTPPRLLPIAIGSGITILPAITASGHRLAYIRSAAGNDALFVQDLPNGVPRRLSYGSASNLRSVAWSPNEDRLLVLSATDSGVAREVIDVKTGEVRRVGALLPHAESSSAVWARQGASILSEWAGADGRMVETEFDLTTGKEVTLFTGPDSKFVFYVGAVSPDGRQALIWSNADSTAPWMIQDLPSGRMSRVPLSFDGGVLAWTPRDEIYYVRRLHKNTMDSSGVFVTSLRGGPSRVAFRLPHECAHYFDISQDRSRAICVEGTTESDVWVAGRNRTRGESTGADDH